MNDDVNQDHIEQEIISSNGLVLPDQQQPDKLYIIPVHNRPFFPAQVLPVIVNEDPWAETLERVAKTPHQRGAL
ncbi:MAG TPA: hypothetical protein DCX26_14375, partial [Pseudomonas sp.]|nr:hypothetical protein [Pseudomonas sp.]